VFRSAMWTLYVGGDRKTGASARCT